MKKMKLTLSVNPDLIKEAKKNNVNISGLLEKALRERRLFPEETNTRSTNIDTAEVLSSNLNEPIPTFYFTYRINECEIFLSLFDYLKNCLK